MKKQDQKTLAYLGIEKSDLITAGYSLSDLRTAGYSASDLITAGYSLSDLRTAGYSLSDIKKAEEFWNSIPVVSKFYTYLLNGINEHKLAYQQSTFGTIEDFDPARNVCGTAMCIAGHWLLAAGRRGYELKSELGGFAQAARVLHAKNYPNQPCPDFMNTNQATGLACIERMAERCDNGLPFFDEEDLKK